ncbi:hypothetical protein BST34_26610 [Mycolicibacterium monacense DSM 44395]|nr:hypothetical protein BST34_26610 [Mycolicibacterium monacense DSM 44395]
MTGSGAWPETDESVFNDRAEALRGKLTELTSANETWEGHRSSIFNGTHIWSGTGAGKASLKADKSSQSMRQHEDQLRAAITWCDEAASKIVGAKETISTNVRSAQADIERILREAAEKDQDPTAAVQSLVNREYFENFDTVSQLAVGLGGAPGVPLAPFDESDDAGSKNQAGSEREDRISTFGHRRGDVISTEWSPPGRTDGGINAAGPALTRTGEVRAPTRTGEVVSAGWSPEAPPTQADPSPAREGPRNGDVVNAGWTPAPSPPNAPPSGSPATRPASPSVPLPASAGPQPLGGAGGGGVTTSGTSPVASAPTAGSTGGSDIDFGGGRSDSGSSASPISDGSSAIGDQPSVDPSNGASGPSSGAGGQPPIQSPPIADRLSNIGPAMQPASAPMAAPVAPTDVAPPAAAAPSNPTTSSAAHAPVAPVSPPATGGGVPMAGGPAMPPPPMPLGPPPTPSPAAPVVPASAVPPPVAAPTSSAGSVVGAPAPVPVSAARAERDAIAGSMRRQSAGDPVQVARRVAAALNAVESMDFGFFWATGVTKDGTILVANSYGIGYIPDGVKLPDGVRMVSADESIPIDERAKWATFPMLALHGWAQHHDVPLRAVVATAEQFDGFDPGAARVILTPDDIPERGDMAGRSRLEVIAPGAARQLASVDDTRLGDLLPPAPADTTPPADNSLMLWFETMKPLMSTSAERGAAHLEAMVSYANHAQELALHRAQTATDAATQRAAIADWVYWQHVSVMSNDAIVIRQ